MTKKTLTTRYLEALAHNPLLTKCITGGVLAILNEMIATSVSGQYNVSTVLNRKLRHPFSPKLVLFALYAFIVATPISHYGYQWLNKLFRPRLSSRQKVLQIIGSMATITPLSSTLFVAFVAVMNMKPGLRGVSGAELQRAWANIQESWKKSLLTVMKTSWMTGPVAVAFCQKFVPPELWTVFTNLCYFVLGTFQNTMLKMRTKKAYDEKKREVVDEAEANSSDDGAPSEVLKESTTTGVDTTSQ